MQSKRFFNCFHFCFSLEK